MSDQTGILREFLFYPDAKRVQAMPREQLRPFMLDRLTEQEQRKVPDFERCLGLGQLAGLLQVDDVEAALERWLGEHDTPNGHDASALFLQGYWMKRPVTSPQLVRSLLDAFAKFPAARGMRDTVVTALAAAYPKVDSTSAEEIRKTFLGLQSVYAELQPAVRKAISSVIGDWGIVAPSADGDHFRAYACEDGSRRYFAIDRIATHAEVARVSCPVVSDRMLLLEYQILDVSMRDEDVRRVIFNLLLVALLHDTYRDQVDRVRYVNCSSKRSLVIAYGEDPA